MDKKTLVICIFVVTFAYFASSVKAQQWSYLNQNYQQQQVFFKKIEL